MSDRLLQEAEAARALIANLGDIIRDDDELASDMIGAETNFFEAVDGALARLDEIDALTDAISAQASKLSARKSRLETQAERIRIALATAMEMAALRKAERPRATLSLKPTPPSVVITNEADIPSRFQVQQMPKINKRLILAALKDGDAVPGAELSNGGVTVAIKRG